MSMASIAPAEAGVHLQDITEGHMMIELEITHLSDLMKIVVDDQTLCHQGIDFNNFRMSFKVRVGSLKIHGTMICSNNSCNKSEKRYSSYKASDHPYKTEGRSDYRSDSAYKTASPPPSRAYPPSNSSYNNARF